MIRGTVKGYTLHRVNGRYLVYAEDNNCFFMNEQQTILLPLFAGDSGRYTIEANGWLGYPDDIAPQMFDTGKAFETFYVSEQLTEAESPI